MVVSQSSRHIYYTAFAQQIFQTFAVPSKDIPFSVLFAAVVNAGTCYICISKTHLDCVWEGFDTSTMKPQACSDSYNGECFKQQHRRTIGRTTTTVGKH